MPAQAHSAYTGRIIVRLTTRVAGWLAKRDRDSAAPDFPTLQALIEEFGKLEEFDFSGLQAVLRRYPDLPSHPSVLSVPGSKVLEREAQAHGSPLEPRKSLTSYFVLDPRGIIDPAEMDGLVRELNELPGVELAYRERSVRSPGWAVDPGDPLVKEQGYLDAAPRGIGANTNDVWGRFNGSGIGFVDLEAGWNLQHAELPKAKIDRQPMLNLNDALDANHGTGVLGIVLAKASGKGITGIAPGAKFMGVVSWLVPQSFDVDIPSAIHKAMEVLDLGDVLLLEVATSIGYPIELDDAVFTAIRTATAHGIIVVEAAGNGDMGVGIDLDQPLPEDGKGPQRSLNRTAGNFADSGAIMVSACHSAEQNGAHRRINHVDFGSRIDCYGWGDKVKTLTAQDDDSSTDFINTSAAAAIIAGAAILVQQMVVTSGKSRLSPSEMRALLADPALGTAIRAPSGTTKIGVMPNLEAIADKLVRA
jgi:serine protease